MLECSATSHNSLADLANRLVVVLHAMIQLVENMVVAEHCLNWT